MKYGKINFKTKIKTEETETESEITIDGLEFTVDEVIQIMVKRIELFPKAVQCLKTLSDAIKSAVWEWTITLRDLKASKGKE